MEVSQSKTPRKTLSSEPKSKRQKKTRFSITIVLNRIREAVAPFPKAALFELFALGYTTAFEQLVACIISIRTRDEVTVPTARRLFAAARSAPKMARLSLRKIDTLIHSCSFHRPKAAQFGKSRSSPFATTLAKSPAMKQCFSHFAVSGPNVRISCSASRAVSLG
jgi:endonuclease-3